MSRSKSDSFGCWSVVVVVVLVLLVGFSGNLIELLNTEMVTATVIEKEYVEGTYLIFTDKDVFKNDDNFSAGKLNSSDVYSELEVGKTYKFKVGGFRSRLMSWYKNILEYKEV